MAEEREEQNVPDIQRKYSLEIKIDNEEFPIVYRIPTKAERKHFRQLVDKAKKEEEKSNEGKKEQKKLTKKLSKLRRKLGMNIERYRLTKDEEEEEKLKLLDEREQFEEQIETLEEQVEGYEPASFEETMKRVESINKEQFETLVSGDGVDGLQEYIDEYDGSYIDMMNLIKKKLPKAHEKK